MTFPSLADAVLPAWTLLGPFGRLGSLSSASGAFQNMALPARVPPPASPRGLLPSASPTRPPVLPAQAPAPHLPAFPECLTLPARNTPLRRPPHHGSVLLPRHRLLSETLIQPVHWPPTALHPEEGLGPPHPRQHLGPEHHPGPGGLATPGRRGGLLAESQPGLLDACPGPRPFRVCPVGGRGTVGAVSHPELSAQPRHRGPSGAAEVGTPARRTGSWCSMHTPQLGTHGSGARAEF